jgi:uncharacterized protein YigE (DUF2233 family)
MRWLVAWLLMASPALAVVCTDVDYAGARYTACTVNAATEHLRLFLHDRDGTLYGDFAPIERTLDVETLAFAMNAGMYHPDRAPVGLYIENGEELAPLVKREGPGNFGLLPNGVFCIRDGRADVIETLAYAANPPACRDATQSGPMLVIDGALHPRFLRGGTSRFIRNGVGTSADGKTAVFVISDVPVSFHEFGSFFRDGLGLPNALYFDGKVSRLHAPGLNRSDAGFALGPIVGVID